MRPLTLIVSCIVATVAHAAPAAVSRAPSPSRVPIAVADEGQRTVDIAGTRKKVAIRTRQVSTDEAECNGGGYAEGTAGRVVFCRGEDWALPSTVERSEEGRLIVSMSPWARTGDDDDPYTEIYNSPDWHGYTVNAGWGQFEGYDDDGTAAHFEREPYLSEYLFRDYYDENEDGEVWYGSVYSLYKLSEIPCVRECIERLGEENADLCRTLDRDDMIWDDVMPWFKLWGADDLGVCLDDEFVPSISYDLTNTSAGHNGNDSPKWLGELGVSTIFEAFEDWCVANPDRCDTTYVINAYELICASEDCTGSDSYRDVYDNFDVVEYDEDHDLYVDEFGAVEDRWINAFLKQRREYSHLSYAGDRNANVYAFFDSAYIDYQCRFFQKLLATIDKFDGDYAVPFTMYLNAESGNLGTLPNTILTVDEIDEWAQNLIDVGLSISEGISDGMLAVCDLEPYEITTLQNYLGDDSNGIWSVNINNGGRVFREWARQAIANGMGVATHGETATMTHHFLQHFYPFIQYDQENLTYRSCLNELNCDEFIPDLEDSVRLVDHPPFDSAAWETVKSGARPFSHIHVDMTHLHKDVNTLAQYRKHRMSALGALSLGINQIKLSYDQIPGQGVNQEYNACPNTEEDYEYSCENLMNHEDDEGNPIDFGANACNVNWSCVEDHDPYSFMQWVGKNIGTSVETAPEAYCALFSSGAVFEGDFDARIREIWDSDDWELEDDEGVWTQNYNRDQAPAVRSPYTASMGRFCTLDTQNSSILPSRDLLTHYGFATPDWSGFPHYDPSEATRPGEGGVLWFRLNQTFIEENSNQVDGYTVKVVFAAGPESEDEGTWALSYFDGSNWVLEHGVTFDPVILEDDIYTATFHLDGEAFSGGGDENGNHLQIRAVAGDPADFLLVRIIPILSDS